MTIADKIQRLQAAKTAIANAITAKGGTVQSGDGFEDFGTDIATIPSGITPTGNIDITDTQSTDVTNYATAQVVDADLVAGNIKKDVNVLGVTGTYDGGSVDPDLTVFDYSKFTDILQPTSTYWAQTFSGKKAKVIFPDSWNDILPSFFDAPTTLEEVELVCNGTVTGVKENVMCYSTSVKKITMNFSTANFTAKKFKGYFFRALGTPEKPLEIYGQPLDFSGVESSASVLCGSGGFFYQAHINYVRFKPNTLNMSGTAYLDGSFNYLDDDSLVSLYNVFGETTTGTLCAYKTKAQSLMGRVDTSQGYNLFVKDDSGTMSLADFATNVKGWTLA